MNKYNDDWETLGDRIPDEIKNWVVVNQKDERHPVEKLVDREKAAGSDVPMMASGGFVPEDPDEIDPREIDALQAQAAAIPPAQVPMPETQAIIEPRPVSAPAAAPVDYGVQADKIMGSTPESRQAVFDRTQAPSIGNAIGSFGAGLGDAIARSYGHDAGANHQKTFQGIIEGRNQAYLQNEKDKVSMGKERFGISQQLEAKSPSSPLSQQLQQTYGPLLKKIGFSDEDIFKMSASNISDLTGKSVDMMKAESEAAMAAASLGLNTYKAKAEVEHQKKEDESSAKKERAGAAKQLAERGVWKRTTDFITQNPATKVLEQQAGLRPADNEVERRTKDGKIGIYDVNTKQFLRYK